MAECVSKWIYAPTLTLIQPVSLSASLAILSSLLLSSCFFLFNGSHMSGKGLWHRGDDLRSGHAGLPGVRSQCSAYSTQSRLRANPPVQTAPSPAAWSLCYWGEKKLFVMCVSAASRPRYCSNASTLEKEPPKTAIIASLRIFLLPPVGL